MRYSACSTRTWMRSSMGADGRADHHQHQCPAEILGEEMPLNLIVVVFDTLRYDAVFGDLARTPNLDRFAAQSASFHNAWGEGLPTIPFRRALHTGVRAYPWNDQGPERGLFPNLFGWHCLPESQTTIAEYLYARGYATQLIADVYHMF